MTVVFYLLNPLMGNRVVHIRFPSYDAAARYNHFRLGGMAVIAGYER